MITQTETQKEKSLQTNGGMMRKRGGDEGHERDLLKNMEDIRHTLRRRIWGRNVTMINDSINRVRRGKGETP